MPMNPRLLRPLATGFNPRSIAGLALWIDFADASTVRLDVNDKIEEVLDKSGNGLHGIQSTSGNRMGISTLNGRQCADNGTSSNQFHVQYLRGAATDNFRDGFVAAVWDDGGSVFPSFVSFFSAAGITGTLVGNIVVGSNGNNRFETGIWTNASNSITRINNTQVVNASPLLEPFPAITTPFVFRGTSTVDTTADGWQIGSDRANAGRGWRGRIGETIIYNRQLSDADSLRVRTYLARKWGAPTQS